MKIKIALFLPITLTFIISCKNKIGEIKAGEIVGTGWYNPAEQSSIYIQDGTTAIYTFFSPNIFNPNGSKDLRKEYEYTFGKGNKILHFNKLGLLHDFNLTLNETSTISNDKRLTIVNAEYSKAWVYEPDYISKMK